MNVRQKNIILLLSRSENYQTAHSIASELNVNEKTIRSDIQLINKSETSFNVIPTKGKGYQISVNDELEYFRVLKKIKSIDSSSKLSVDRIDTIYSMLLLSTDDFISLEKIEDSHYLSNTHVKRLMQSIATNLALYGLDLIYDSRKGYRVEGTTFDKRTCMSEFSYHQAGNGLTIFNDSYVRKDILSIIESNGIKMSPDQYSNFLIHLEIAVRFIMNEQDLKEKRNYNNVNIADTFEYFVAEDISKYIYEMLNIRINKFEKEHITVHILSKKSYPVVLIENCTYDALPREKYEIVRSIIDEINNVFRWNLKQDGYFVNSLAMTVDSLKQRQSLGTYYRYANINEIKSRNLSFFVISIYILSVFFPEMQYKEVISEASIISLHLNYSQLRNINKPKHTIACLVPYKGIESELVVSQLNGFLSNIVKNIDLFTENQITKEILEPYKLVVSTSLKSIDSLHDNVVYLSTLLNENDYIKIVKRLNGERIHKVSQHSFSYYFGNRDDVIEYLLENQDIITGENKVSIFKNVIEFPKGYLVYVTVSESNSEVTAINFERKLVWFEYAVSKLFIININSKDNYFEIISEGSNSVLFKSAI